MRLVARCGHLIAFILVACATLITTLLSQAPAPPPATPIRPDDFTAHLLAAAKQRPNVRVRYDGKYVRLAYPGGDVPADTGVCTDEIIRIYRAVGIDLQKEVHEDMRANFPAYPRAFGLGRPDPNIDHRRVPNLRAFFTRKGTSLPVSASAADYEPGDLVTWELGRGLTHIGMVVDYAFGERNGIVHNIGAGPQLEDVLFAWKITGHYRYRGPGAASATPAPPRRTSGRAPTNTAARP
jgi:uncharacterized protein